MEFERFLNKYLNGSLNDQELEQFRALLDHSPHYREELRQILDLRSAIQDDALHLTPPESLSETVRLAVGASFATARLGDRQPVVEEKRRRAVWAPYRMAGVVAVIMAVAIPFGPELFRGAVKAPGVDGKIAMSSPASGVDGRVRTSDRSGNAGSRLSDGGSSSTNASGNERAGSGADVSGTSSPASGGPALAASIAPIPSDAGRSGAGSASLNGTALGSDDEARNGRARHSAEGSDLDATFASNSISLPAELSVQQGVFERSGLIRSDMQTLLKPRDVDAFGGILAASEPIGERNDPMLAALTHQDPLQAVTGSNDARLLTVGVTLGAGQVSKAKSATALLQNSYYFAVSVSQSDRIGIEMGAAAFEQVKSVISYTPTGSSDPTGSAFAKRSELNNKNGSDIARLPDRPIGTGLGYSSPSDVMLPIGEFDPSRGMLPVSVETRQSPQGGGPSYRTTLVEQRLEQQITYGAVFYDHRIRVTNDIDLCGRLAFGGADAAVVGGVRAYAAYSPSKTVTFTLGVGGSTLYNVTQQSTGGSSNYGIYYGIETGF